MDRQDIQKKNFFYLILEGTFFFTGMSFLDANSVVPVFIDTYTGSLQLAGLATTLKAASSLSAQLFIGPYVNKIKYMPSFITKCMFLFRPLPMLMIPLLLGDVDPYLTVGAFLAIFSLLWASDGIVVVPWLDVFGRTIPGHKRGKLLGYQQVFGGIGGLAAGFIIKSTLQNPVWSNGIKYSIIFGLSGLVLLISSMMMVPVRDLPRKTSNERVNFRNYFGRLPEYYRKNKSYASMVTVQVISSFTNMILPFIILFGKKTFMLEPAQVSTLIYIQIIGTLVGGVFWGTLSHRFGNKYVILTSQIIGFTLSAMALASLLLGGVVSHFVFLWPMAILTGVNMGNWMGFVNYTIDVVSEDDRPVYLVLTSVITFPFTFVNYLAGLMADLWGFVPLFIVGGAAATVGIVLASRLLSPQQMKDIETKSSSNS